MTWLKGSLAAVLLAGSVSGSQTVQWNRIAEENAVLIVVIDSTYNTRPAVALRDLTESEFSGRPSQYREGLQRTVGVDSALIADFELINRERRSLIGIIPNRVFFEVVGDSVFRSFSRETIESYWGAFRARFPGKAGILTVSRPGFNADHSVAIVDMFLGCGGRCGSGGLFILRKTDGVWRVIARPIVTAS